MTAGHQPVAVERRHFLRRRSTRAAVTGAAVIGSLVNFAIFVGHSYVRSNDALLKAFITDERTLSKERNEALLQAMDRIVETNRETARDTKAALAAQSQALTAQSDRIRVLEDNAIAMRAWVTGRNKCLPCPAAPACNVSVTSPTPVAAEPLRREAPTAAPAAPSFTGPGFRRRP